VQDPDRHSPVAERSSSQPAGHERLPYTAPFVRHLNVAETAGDPKEFFGGEFLNINGQS
jgi:hypothetical protein